MKLDDLLHPVYTKDGVRAERQGDERPPFVSWADDPFTQPRRDVGWRVSSWDETPPGHIHRTHPRPTIRPVEIDISADANAFREATDRLTEELSRLSSRDDRVFLDEISGFYESEEDM